MHIGELLRSYAKLRDVTGGTVGWLSIIVHRFDEWLGRPGTIDDLIDDRVNEWTVELLTAGGLARSTVKGYRRGLLILWRFALEQGIVQVGPARLRRIKVPQTLPVAWTAKEVKALAFAAARLPGRLKTGLPRGAFCLALIMVAWDSGLRLRDLLRLRWSDFDRRGAGALVQAKTGSPVMFQLSAGSLTALEGIRRPKRDLVFGGVASRKAVYLAMRMAAEEAGLTGGTRKIRKSGATAVECDLPGGAMGYLGHRTHGLAERHYIDPRLVQKKRQSPPPIELPPGREPPEAA